MAILTSRAQKLRAKRARQRGRPKIEDAPRTPSGQISRAREPADVVAIEARMRQTGLPRDKARDQKAASFIGYLNLIGTRAGGISDDQYDAAISFRDLRDGYLRAIKAPNGLLSSGLPGSPGDEITEAYEDWCKRTIERYGECRKAVQEAQNQHRGENLWAALDLVIIQDQRLEHMVGATRLLCNALARFFRP